MIEYERIDISEGIDINKTNKSKERMLCHYWYFLDNKFSYGPYLFDGYYNIMQKSNNFKNISIVHVKKSVYRIKRDAKILMANSNLTDKKVHYKKVFSLYIKMNNTTYYQRNRDMALSKAKENYKNNNGRLKKQSRDKYRNLSEEDKKKKREYEKK